MIDFNPLKSMYILSLLSQFWSPETHINISGLTSQCPRGLASSGGSRGESTSLLFQPRVLPALSRGCVSAVFKASVRNISAPSSQCPLRLCVCIFLLCLLQGHFCWHLELTWLTHDNLPVSRSLISSAESPFPKKVAFVGFRE